MARKLKEEEGPHKTFILQRVEYQNFLFFSSCLHTNIKIVQQDFLSLIFQAKQNRILDLQPWIKSHLGRPRMKFTILQVGVTYEAYHTRIQVATTCEACHPSLFMPFIHLSLEKRLMLRLKAIFITCQHVSGEDFEACATSHLCHMSTCELRGFLKPVPQAQTSRVIQIRVLAHVIFNFELSVKFCPIWKNFYLSQSFLQSTLFSNPFLDSSYLNLNTFCIQKPWHNLKASFSSPCLILNF